MHFYDEDGYELPSPDEDNNSLTDASADAEFEYSLLTDDTVEIALSIQAYGSTDTAVLGIRVIAERTGVAYREYMAV